MLRTPIVRAMCRVDYVLPMFPKHIAYSAAFCNKWTTYFHLGNSLGRLAVMNQRLIWTVQGVIHSVSSYVVSDWVKVDKVLNYVLPEVADKLLRKWSLVLFTFYPAVLVVVEKLVFHRTKTKFVYFMSRWVVLVGSVLFLLTFSAVKMGTEILTLGWMLSLSLSQCMYLWVRLCTCADLPPNGKCIWSSWLAHEACWMDSELDRTNDWPTTSCLTFCMWRLAQKYL